MSFFSIEELHQPAGFGLAPEDYPAEYAVDPTRWPALQTALDTIRVSAGSPLYIRSGWRSPEYNLRMYTTRGEKPTDSQHSQGRAADIYCLQMPADILHDLIMKLYRTGVLQIGGLGKYNTFVHVDVRVGWDHLATWDLSTNA